MSAERKQCAAQTLWHGEPVRCGAMTALRMDLRLRGPDREWIRRPDGRAALVSQAVCSRHKGYIESHGLRGIDPECLGEVVQ